jgi:pimeloyl-ACP methyl ester carboxylesterase
VYLRYNTGLHISENGRSLDTLLGALVEAWPVPVPDVVLIGHSMGGLVARSALHQAGGGTPDARGWTRLVRDTVTLGSPHLGAPLERGVHRLTAQLTRLPETRPLARLLTLRSVGIKDLRRGTLVEADWTGRDLDALTPGEHTHVPLHDGARHFVVLVTLSRNPEGRAADLLGDLLVPPRSASGDTGDDDRLAFPPDHVHRIGGMHHFDLLNHPLIYARIRTWLEERPEGARPSAPESPHRTESSPTPA